MKCPCNRSQKFLISPRLLCGQNKLKLVEKTGEIFLYSVEDEQDFADFCGEFEVLHYLDNFLILLPQDCITQRRIWGSFYHSFGTIYEKLIDIEQNLECIKWMLQYIDQNMEIRFPKKVLDYGCGTGISMEIGYNGMILGYEPIEAMRTQAIKKGMRVFCKSNIHSLPDGYFDAFFASYVFHMAINEQDVLQIFSKVRVDAVGVANFYKGINEVVVNNIFQKLNFTVRKIEGIDERFGPMYEYRRKEGK